MRLGRAVPSITHDSIGARVQTDQVLTRGSQDPLALGSYSFAPSDASPGDRGTLG